MTEFLEVYDLKSTLIKTEDRKKYYQSIKSTFEKEGKVRSKVKTIRLLLMNSKGRIYLQKRSKLKNQNSGLYDKTIGGHVSAGDSFNMTVIRESAEELGFPATVLTDDDFQKAIKVTNLNIIGIFRKVDYFDSFESKRLIGKKLYTYPQMCEIFIGYYDGAIRFADGESSGIEVFSLEELKQELKENPEKFTEDIRFMIKKYEKYLKPV